jgi:hypothetical protein
MSNSVVAGLLRPVKYILGVYCLPRSLAFFGMIKAQAVGPTVISVVMMLAEISIPNIIRSKRLLTRIRAVVPDPAASYRILNGHWTMPNSVL